MDDKTCMALEDINSDLQSACSVAFVITEALHLNGSDAATYAGAMSLLSDVIFHVEKNIDELIYSAKRCGKPPTYIMGRGL